MIGTAAAPAAPPGLLRAALLVFVVAFGARAASIAFYVSRYDRDERVPQCTCGKHLPNHAMVKGDELKYYHTAVGILRDVREGRSPWTTGGAHDGPWVFPRVLALYGFATGRIRLDERGVPPSGEIEGFLYLHAFFFALALIPFLAALRRAVGPAVALGAALFLALEPTLVQYSARLLSETLFFAFLALTVAFWLHAIRLDPGRGRLRFVLTWVAFGVLLGLDFLNRPISIWLGLPLALARFVPWPRGRVRAAFLSVALFFAAYAAVLGTVGLQNYARSGVFYVMPLQGRPSPLRYGVTQVLADMKGTDPMDERRALMEDVTREAVEAGAIDGDENWTDREHIAFGRICQARAMEFFREHPGPTARVFSRNIVSALGVNPFDVPEHFRLTYKPEDRDLAERQVRDTKRTRPIKIAYSVLILGPVALGWFLALRAGKNPAGIHFLLVLLILYFPGVAGWFGNRRLLLPSLIPYSVFWAWAVVAILRRRRPRGVP
ncbi:MAG: glycosyltransferase family 39 protein [Planctomycetes bacterium]|nr:glycosyltransferase family 39 protein [Planctomycetota bacterium]